MWKFKPIYKPTIWGGYKIARLKRFESDERIGECWALSGIDGRLSAVEGGCDDGLSIRQLIDRDGAALLGKKNFKRFGDTFPLLIKLIDASDTLSVQVHPDDEMAQRRGLPYGKTEMWYVLPSDEEAQLTIGFNADMSREQFLDMVASGNIESALNRRRVAPGDVYLIPPGTVHAIGQGCFLVEIQQTSDETYRIYDYKRRDDSGNERELHLDLALEALDFSQCDGLPVPYTARPDIPVNVVRTPYFSTNVMTIDEPILRDYSECDSFVIIIATAGKAELATGTAHAELRMGELALIPASSDNVTITPDGDFTALEVYIKQ